MSHYSWPIQHRFFYATKDKTVRSAMSKAYFYVSLLQPGMKDDSCKMWWLKPAIWATWDSEIWRITVQGQL
jgi:hypothetical protein